MADGPFWVKFLPLSIYGELTKVVQPRIIFKSKLIDHLDSPSMFLLRGFTATQRKDGGITFFPDVGYQLLSNDP